MKKGICKKMTTLPLSSEGIPGGYIDTDPQGSYTGRPASIEELPVQDADDL